jgi:hypothetical protein
MQPAKQIKYNAEDPMVMTLTLIASSHTTLHQMYVWCTPLKPENGDTLPKMGTSRGSSQMKNLIFLELYFCYYLLLVFNSRVWNCYPLPNRNKCNHKSELF